MQAAPLQIVLNFKEDSVKNKKLCWILKSNLKLGKYHPAKKETDTIVVKNFTWFKKKSTIPNGQAVMRTNPTAVTDYFLHFNYVRVKNLSPKKVESL